METTPPNQTPLRRARRLAGLTATSLAAAVGIDQANISRIERGLQRASPDLAAKLAARLGNITEMEILYPERYVGTKGAGARKGRATA